MAYVLELSIPWVPGSLNKKLRSNYRTRSKENKAWDVYIWASTRLKRPATPLERVRLSFCRHSSRTLDFDGFVGSLKPVVDALVLAGILKDDTWKVTGPWIIDQKPRHKKLGQILEIRVEQV